MSRRRKPSHIVGISQFEADMTVASQLILKHAHSVRVTSPHYWALQNLHAKLIETMVTVTGMEVPWVRNRGSFNPEEKALADGKEH